ncbi:hypothetical protein DM02DRAFT_689968 [Periconia macrospinosa]|uniref:VOC domain-containing protein n=1 Tax=Periconia macrospinosa TaxID=97972 RepID=A0A2V1DEB1_9PLEO|nr:hypothetical protein DM02DRAFT_689968 [Periconia macrospinosa]
MKPSNLLSRALPLIVATLVTRCISIDTGNETMWFAPDCSPVPGFEHHGSSHFSVIAQDLDRTISFYEKAFGFRLVFIFSPIPEYKAAYLGHNRGNYPSCQAWAGSAVEETGQIEILWLENASSKLPPTTKEPNTFSHIGIYTPDVAAACERVAAQGGKILKPKGEWIESLESPVAIAYGLDPSRIKNLSKEKRAALLEGLKNPVVGFNNYCFATDLDGNILEIQPTVL